MKIDKLPLNEPIKNYKSLCELLGIPVCGGSSKQAQIKEIQRYCDLQKIDEKQSYIVSQVYSKPLEKIDGRTKGNNTQYIHLMTDIFADYLATVTDDNNNKVCINSNKVCQVLNLYNKNWSDFIYANDGKRANLMTEIAYDLGVSRNSIKFFSNVFMSKLQPVKRNLCEYLLKNGYIKSYRNSWGFYSKNSKRFKRQADSEEEQEINKIQQDVLETLVFLKAIQKPEIQYVYMYHNQLAQEIYSERFDDEIRERFGAKYSVRPITEIIVTDNVTTDKNLWDDISSLNYLFSDSVYNSAEKKYTKLDDAYILCEELKDYDKDLQRYIVNNNNLMKDVEKLIEYFVVVDD